MKKTFEIDLNKTEKEILSEVKLFIKENKKSCCSKFTV